MTLEKEISSLETKRGNVLRDIKKITAEIDTKQRKLNREYLDEGKMDGLAAEIAGHEAKRTAMQRALETLEIDLMTRRAEMTNEKAQALNHELVDKVSAIRIEMLQGAEQLEELLQKQVEWREKLTTVMGEASGAGLDDPMGIAKRLLQIWPWAPLASAAGHLVMPRPYVIGNFIDALRDNRAEWKVKVG
jgi:hypothetical protein